MAVGIHTGQSQVDGLNGGTLITEEIGRWRDTVLKEHHEKTLKIQNDIEQWTESVLRKEGFTLGPVKN